MEEDGSVRNEKKRSSRDKKKSSKRSKLFDGSNKGLITKILIAATVLAIVCASVAFLMSGLLLNQKQLFVTTTVATTTKKSGNAVEFSIGQLCQYHNQCPQLAFCSGTCQCPLHYYYNQTMTGCILRKTSGANCTSDDECNIVVGLICSTTCKCDTEHFWNSTYVIGGGLPLGRCQNKKSFGMACSASEGVGGINYANYFGSQIRRCWCESGWDQYLNIRYGRCQYNARNQEMPCVNTAECHQAYGLCVDLDGDGKKHCDNIPTIMWYQSFRWRFDFGNTGCFPTTLRCNEWKNLVCRLSTTNVATCLCIDDYYYFNNTMCVYGSRYAESCSASAQCTPTAASMVCALPFTGALNTVCRCNSATQYYDLVTNRCLSLKALNVTCRENAECSGASTDSMFCGHYVGGSARVCLCTDAFYPSGTTCVAKLAFSTACSSTAQCMNHLGQICTGGTCGCATGKYYDSSDFKCKHLDYYRDTCTTNSECWSGVCSSGLCN